MALPVRPFTFEDLAALPTDGFRHELIDGEFHLSPAPSYLHQLFVQELERRLSEHVLRHGLGVVFQSPADVKLNDFTGIQPDLFCVRRGRANVLRFPIIDGAPDLVVEVLSPSTRTYDREIKQDAYTAAGVAEYWIVDPDVESALALGLTPNGYHPLPQERGRISSVAVAGFVLDVADLFAAVRAQVALLTDPEPDEAP